MKSFSKLQRSPLFCFSVERIVFDGLAHLLEKGKQSVVVRTQWYRSGSSNWVGNEIRGTREIIQNFVNRQHWNYWHGHNCHTCTVRIVVREWCIVVEFFTIGVSVTLSDISLHREEQKKFVKNCPQWGWKPGCLDLQANALPTELGRNLLGRRFLKWALFVSYTTSHVGLWSFLEHDFIKAVKFQANVDLAQLVRHWPHDPQVLVSSPTGGNFWQIFFCSSFCKDLSDNLTETPIVKNSSALVQTV